MNDVIEVSYTGDLLAHRRCPRVWCYEKYAGFHPYEQVQAMEGRLVHHAMEWLAMRFKETKQHAMLEQTRQQLEHYFRILWARGFRTAFTTKQETLDRVVANLFPKEKLHPTIKAVVEGAQHTEYELRAVRKLIKADFAGKSRLMLTGVLDVVVQQQEPLNYAKTWKWTDLNLLKGEVRKQSSSAAPNDLEIWDYKGTQSRTPYVADYVLQLLTYSALYLERTGLLPKRCVLFFLNEQKREEQLLAVPVDDAVVKCALKWTEEQVRALRQTMLQFEESPCSVEGGSLEKRAMPIGKRTDKELAQQCTACMFRFDCGEYKKYLGGKNHVDTSLTNVFKN